MKSFVWFIGLILSIYLFLPEKEPVPVVSYENTENKISFSDNSFPPLSDIHNSENNFTFCSRDFRLTLKKRNSGQYHFMTAKFPGTRRTIKEEYYTCKSRNLFLIYQFSLSLWKVLRQ
jgi:hypothetical protein